MSNEDVKKGIKIQAEADAKKQEKLTEALEIHGEILNQIRESDAENQEILGAVLDEMSIKEANELYGIGITKLPYDLDNNEQNLLDSALYSLLSKEKNATESQKEFFMNIENNLKGKNRDSSFDFSKLKNIDSQSDRRVILEVLCSFLFLNKNDLSFISENSWIYDFAFENDIKDTCGRIQKEFDILGEKGIVNRYRIKIELENESESEENQDTISEYSENQSENEKYREIWEMVRSYTQDELSFGKNINNAPRMALWDIKKSFPNLGHNTIISVSKIGNGYLFFTTAALYLKTTDKFNGHYLRLPYRNIDADNISFGLGKIKDTRKIVIPYQDENGTKKSAVIDDAKLLEERLGDLLRMIKESNVEIASNDMYLNLPDLSMEEKTLYFKALGNILLREEYNLAELYLEMTDYGMDENWNDIASSFDQNECLEQNIKTFLDNVPYPSRDRISQQAVLLALQTICRTNRIESTELSKLYKDDESLIRLFDTNNIDEKGFSKLLSAAVNSQRKINLNDIFYIMERLPKETLYYEDIRKGADDFANVVKTEAENRKNRLPNKVINTIGEKGEDLVNFAGEILKKTKLPIGNKKEEKIVIPKNYKKGKKIPREYGLPKDAEAYGIVSENGNGTIIMYEVTEEQTMPFDNPQWVIDMLHNSMGESEGIIEVNNGITAGGRPYIYEIIKHHMKDEEEGYPGRMTYTLNINVRFDNSIQFINGSFAEGNTTGMRDSVVYAMYMKTKDEKPDEVGEWFYDPYDPNYTKGLRMNVSERAGFDEEFPWHPLSMCRNLVKFIIDNN